jgi:hypothetical protein
VGPINISDTGSIFRLWKLSSTLSLKRSRHAFPEWSVVKIGRAFVLLDGIAAVDDDHLAGDVG